jgi:hypothetical protein
LLRRCDNICRKSFAAKPTMHWFRSNLRLGSGLALVALVIQVALSLVHAHFGGVAQRPDAPRQVALQTDPAPAALPRTPVPDGRSNGLGDNYCPLCALMHLAGTWLPAAPPALELPAFAVRTRLVSGVQFPPAPPQQRFFQARAPPVA